MRYSQALLAAALALSAAACGQSAPTEPALEGGGFGTSHQTAPAAPSYEGVGWGGGQRTGSDATASTTTTPTDTSTIVAPGSGQGRDVSYGGGQ